MISHKLTSKIGLAIGGLLGAVMTVPLIAIADTPKPVPEPVTDAEGGEDAAPFLRPPMACPEDMETLVTGLLRDLPSYTNRVAARSLPSDADRSGYGTMLLAGRAELEPLEISPQSFSDTPLTSAETVQQVFFTTLERQYTATAVVNLEQYHWLFLTPVENGWRLVLIFSRVAPATTDRPPSPPQESSEGFVGQAVKLWLRDCRAGALYPIDGARPTGTVSDDASATELDGDSAGASGR
ncbi:MAG: hypothetical protein ACFB12_07980 [Leptolyngbyaceae cyanobacterium]